MIPTRAKLSQLSIDAVNVRKANRGAEPIFTGSVRKRGVIQKLLVRQKGTAFSITDGGKRYEALIWLRDHNESAAGVPVTDDYEVPIEVLDESDAVARETSLIVNVARSDTHPVDRFERFAELVKDGAEPEDIALTYGMPLREVEKALALGVLHPTILAAWRSGELRAESAQAFTLAKDWKTQLKVFEKLKKSNQLNSRYTIRTELKAEDQEIGHLLNFVGISAFEAAGGKVTSVDLFEGKHVVSDVDLVGTMATEKLKAECARLVSEGWGWAAPAFEMPNGWDWKWGKVNPKIEFTPDEAEKLKRLRAIADDDEIDYQESEAAGAEVDQIENDARTRAFGPKQMTKSGCVLSISDSGDLDVTYGIVKPDNAKVGDVVESGEFEERRKERVKSDKKKPGSTVLSNALVERLSTQMTAAAIHAVKKRRDDALDITIAAILANGDDFRPGVKLSHTGTGSHKAKGSFKSNYDAIRKLGIIKKLDVLAEAIGMAFDFKSRDATTFRSFRATGLCDILGEDLIAAMRKEFDASDYFNSVSKALCLAAITEAVNADEARKISGKPKADIAKFAIANVPKTSWLPPELRTEHYDGPAAKPTAKPKPKKRAA